MDESHRPDTLDNNLLPEQRPPQANPRQAPAGDLVPAVLSMAGAGAMAYLMIASSMIPTEGATRSARIEMDERRQQIEQAERAAEMDSIQEVAPDGNLNDSKRD